MTAGAAFIIGLVLFGAKMFIICEDYGDLRKCIEDAYPEFFNELPTGYENYLDRVNPSDLMNYLANKAREGSVVHLRSLVNLFPYFVDEVYVDDKDLDRYVRFNYSVYEFRELDVYTKYFSKNDWRRYINRIYPISDRYRQL